MDSITIAPTAGASGTQALVTGSFPNYGPYDVVTVWWEAVHNGRRLGSASLRSDGTFAIPVVIPPEASAGARQLIADVNYGYAQASTTFTVTVPTRSAAYIYESDQTTANDFKSLLESNSISTTLVTLNDVSGTNFVPYDIIFVGHDTGAGYDWHGSATARSKLGNSGKPIVGLGRGGAALFQELELFIRYGQSWTATSRTDVYAVDPAHPIWNVPYDIYVPRDRLVTLYDTPNTHLAIYMPTPVDGVLPLGRQDNNTTHYPLIAQDGRYLLWGFHAGPDDMTQTGQDLLVNVVWHLMRASEIDTLILTDYDRMEDLGYTHADVVALENDINNLIGLGSSITNMTAIHRDLSDDAPAEVQGACSNWPGSEGDVATTNACVTGIDEYIESLKQAAYPNLYYVILVGAHEVIPMKAREQDHLISAQEKNWGAALPVPRSYIHDLYSTPGSNGWGHYLTDSIYGDLSYVSDGWGSDHELVPELAVGRLVETPAQISDLIATYVASHGRFSRTDRVSVASNDYVDGGTLAANLMDPGTDDALVQGSFDSTAVPPKLNGANDLVYLGGHGNYNSISTGGGDAFMAGNHATQGDTAALGNMPNGIIVTSGCHNGVNLGNQLYHAPDTGTTYSEFPEEFAERLLGVYVGATGYTIISGTCDDTDVNLVGHNEKLATYVVQHLDQDGCIAAGEAFRRAINSYVTDVGAIGTAERRVIAITTLYGIPNYRGNCLLMPIWPRRIEYRLRPWWIDPPPYLDPGQFRYRVELDLRDWTVHRIGSGPEWYLEIPGATYGGGATDPLVPVFKAGVILPPGSTVAGVEWNQAASQSTTWTADGPMYAPPITETVEGGDRPSAATVPQAQPPLFAIAGQQGLAPAQPFAAYTTTTTGGAGILAGLRITPLQHDPTTLSTTLWTTLVFTVTFQAGASTDADGDGLPTYWETGQRLDPNDASGDNGAAGDPDGDDLGNDQEFSRGTDPQDPDSDDDGWSDGDEVSWGTDPLNPGSHPYRILLPLVLKAQ